MKHFLKRLVVAITTLALLCCITPAAFADAAFYTVNLEPMGGVVSETHLFAYKVGSTYRLTSLPTPTMDGYTFDGWYDDMVGGSKVTTRTAIKEDDTTLYARWTAKMDGSAAAVTTPAATAQPVQQEFRLEDHYGTLLLVGTTVLVLALVSMH